MPSCSVTIGQLEEEPPLPAAGVGHGPLLEHEEAQQRGARAARAALMAGGGEIAAHINAPVPNAATPAPS